MAIRAMWCGAAAGFIVALGAGSALAQNVRVDPTKMKGSEALRVVFRSVIEKADAATVYIRADQAVERPGGQGRRRSMQVALGTVITADGYILTKASEVVGQDNVRVAIGTRVLEPKIVGVSPQNDLAMLKVDVGTGGKLTPVAWEEGQIKPDIGAWVATSGPTGWAAVGGGANVEEPVAVGVVSVGRRRIPGRSGFLGVALDDAPNGGAIVRQVIPNSAAEKAKLKEGDIITDVNATSVKTRDELINTVKNFRPGDTVTLGYTRGTEKLKAKATLGTTEVADPEAFSMETMLGGPVSKRASDFPVVFEHDTVLRPQDCGGPLVDLTGKVMGINIARAGRTETFALPADVIEPLLEPLMSGKLAPVNAAEAATRPGEKSPTTPASGE